MKLLNLRNASLALIMTTMILGMGMTRPAHATITITPMFVVIEGRERYADVNLINTSDQKQTYDIKWRYFKMDDVTGQYENIDTPTTAFNLAANMIYTPTRVTLGPRETQKVRLALRLKGEIPPPGDYRAHLEFIQIRPELENPQMGPALEEKTAKVGVGLSVAFSIPVIYRIGADDAKAVMGDITTAINNESHQLEMSVPVTREGTTSLMGDLTVYHTPSGGTKAMVGQIRNANIFPEAKSRIFKFPLTVQSLSNGKVEVVLRDADLDKNVVFATRTLNISP